MQGGAVGRAAYSFLVGQDASEQAEAIALTCGRFLAEKNCVRVGVIFPGAGRWLDWSRTPWSSATFRTTTGSPISSLGLSSRMNGAPGSSSSAARASAHWFVSSMC